MGKIKDMRDYVGKAELRELDLWKAVAAEFLGTMVLVFVGTSSCLNGWTEGYAPSVVQISLCFGITLATLAQALGHISGCHVNPAVTCGMLVARHISVVRSLFYIIAQCAGGLVGSAILLGVTPAERQGSLGMTSINPAVNVGQAVGFELLFTFVLVLTVFSVCDERRNDVKGSAPLAIGLSVAACHLAGVPITGASMNPARTFGPAVVAGLWENHWVYWTGPILGGMMAALIYTYLFRAPKITPSYDINLENCNKGGNKA
ncbi:aquaporin AQPAe.a-like [Homarus americanus]|uniref:Aquaporin-like n=1 Tax=Homarus americanus TaxID=6706 RepID=A0A8J5K4I8_HOMAM|nr:aquaporin AQPAe.a-like [Homarus americanus]KAG7169137.1 Aquaporin-like [Homarus americanus]